MVKNMKEKKRKQAIRKYYQNYETNSNNDESSLIIKKKKKYLDSLFVRIFLSSIILLMIVITNGSLNTKTYLLKMSNLTSLVKEFNKGIGNVLPITEVIPVFSSEIYEQVTYDGKVNHIVNTSFDGVSSLTSGIITKINKKDGIYQITIQATDGRIYLYSGLTSFDYYIYAYLNAESILGLATKEEGTYKFEVTITEGDKTYSIYEVCKD